MMRIGSPAALAIVCLLLAGGCAHDPVAVLRTAGTTSTGTEKPPSLNREQLRPYCPAPGTSVDRVDVGNGQNMPRMTYLGEASYRDGVCRFYLGDNRERVFESFGPMPLHPAETPYISDISPRLFPLRVGNTASFVMRTAPWRSEGNGTTFNYRVTYTVLREEVVTLSGRRYETFVLAKTEEGMFENYSKVHHVYNVEKATLIPVRYSKVWERGLPSPTSNWAAVRTTRS
jgi:hypothetical protein